MKKNFIFKINTAEVRRQFCLDTIELFHFKKLTRKINRPLSMTRKPNLVLIYIFELKSQSAE